MPERFLYPQRSHPHSHPPVTPVRKSTPETRELEQEVERLLILTEALWNLLKERCQLDDQALLREVVRIDMSDGKLDGKLPKSPPIPCRSCKRTIRARDLTCLYCGEIQVSNPFAR